MGKLNDYGYGVLTNTDVKVIEWSLSQLKENFDPQEILNVVEIGVRDGKTSRGINKKLNQLKIKFKYWGIDSGKELKYQEPPFSGANLIIKDSTDAFLDLPHNLHWVFIDGCHCVNHVMLDFLNYGYKVVKNGLIVFHDTNENSQSSSKRPRWSYQGHGDIDSPEFGTAIKLAFKKLDILNMPQWKLLCNKFEPDKDLGGVAVFQKIKV